MITFHCEGCGAEVHSFGIDAPPAHGFCGSCAVLNEVTSDIGLDEFWKLYKRLRGPILGKRAKRRRMVSEPRYTYT